ncbi:MAG: hypothetical protein A3J24_02900 [Deltaproteobacteria bacterium RIFCSPLOWO2_02_FULL_53_8]|nr:MAG: hypothetical protein A3J24_02900 [Deltaproteobacteria bacterium RIFCSPLOWO2_02_FULL_53_8]
MSAKETTRQIGLRELLKAQKRRLWTSLREEIFKKLGEEYHEQFSSPQDLEDVAMLNFIEDKGLILADIHRQEIEALDRALIRLDNGTYGLCVECGREIDVERLKVMPYADCCVNCKCKSEEGKRPVI